ncbi:serine-threonine kinase receptor-associated protein-like [Hibiscus syriacus]|uniref:serine-threonine kinase receptor-associated protein-like n=1 Tax=Hibiscus syriacus TaxID=106335 RepID=UPI00192050F9|nr:serine-threonine kinase receptor-associated protein-like [Hibiscus syriacus]
MSKWRIFSDDGSNYRWEDIGPVSPSKLDDDPKGTPIAPYLSMVDLLLEGLDGFFLISASKDSSPMLRNGETGDWIGTFEGHKGAVWSVCLGTNAFRAASASADFSAKVWDALTGDVLHSFEHKHIVRACAFSEVKLFLTFR